MDQLKVVPKGWGYEVHIANSELYCGKQLHFIKGKSCSFHYHIKKDETFFLASGELEVKLYNIAEQWPWMTIKEFDEMMAKGPEQFKDIYHDNRFSTTILKPGDALHIQPYLAHQMTGVLQSDMFEFSTQDFPEDSYRIIKGD